MFGGDPSAELYKRSFLFIFFFFLSCRRYHRRRHRGRHNLFAHKINGE